MNQPNTPTPSAHIDAPDVMHLLRLMGELSALRNDPRNWRRALLTAINGLLPASVSAAFILKELTHATPPAVLALFDAGFPGENERQVFKNEFNLAPFRDPFSLKAIDSILQSNLPSFTAARSDLVSDGDWYDSHHVLQYRKPAGLDDALISIWKGSERGHFLVLYAFRAWGDPQRFSTRAATLLDTLHGGLDWMYRLEETTQRLDRAAALSPRLRQTLECLLAGDTERQSAQKMALSVHTVHDYVKMLYNHFGVSSRGELIARWVHAGGQLPPRSSNDSTRL